MKRRTQTSTHVYKFHRGAKLFFLGVTFVSILTIFLSPFGIALLVYLFRSRITIDDEKLVARGLFSSQVLHRDTVIRVGLYYAPLPDGFASIFARIKLGGDDQGTNLCWQDENEKTHVVCISHFSDPQDIIDRVQEMIDLDWEELSMGTWKLQWPEDD